MAKCKTKQYYVKTVKTVSDIELAPWFWVMEDTWKTGGAEFLPRGRVVYVPGTGLVAQMTCQETNPRTECLEEDGEVCEDSCLEFFINANPTVVGKYINCESNAIGTLHSMIGPDRYDRVPIAKDIRPTVKAEKFEDHWSVTYTISEKALEVLFEIPEGKLKPGHEMTANFYRCGDKTAHKHFLTWNVIGLEKADFHRPEWFGKLVLTEE